MKPTPPLIMLAERRRPKARKVAQVAPLEIALHMAVADVLRKYVKPGWRWGHYPSGEHRDVRTAAKLKAMGVQRGWPDVLLISPHGLLHALELKRRGGVLSEDQAAFQLWALNSGVPHSVPQSIDEALRVLDAWGCLRIKLSPGSGEKQIGGAA